MTTLGQSVSRPLAGLRVLDFTALPPGPLCTLHLADLGAEVIKVEAPKAPDGSRGMPGQQFTKLFLMLARGKQCVAEICVLLRDKRPLQHWQPLAKS